MSEFRRRLHPPVVEKPKKKHHPFLIGFLSTIGMAMLLLCCFAFTCYHHAQKAFNQMNSIDASQPTALTRKLEKHEPFNVLVLGTDTGDLGRHDTGRTDTMMIATVNPKTKTVMLTSIARDTLVTIPGFESRGVQKINAAYNLGGITTAVKTVQQYLKVPIDGYALVNMGGLIKMVDQVNGVQVTSPLSFTFCPQNSQTSGQIMYRFTQNQSAYQVSHDDGKTWETKQMMDGNAALAFSRMRDQDPQGDYGRQARQRLVIEALMHKSINIQTVCNQSFVSKMSQNVRTNLNLADIRLILMHYHINTDQIQSNYLQGSLDQINGIDYQYSTLQQRQLVTNKIRQMLNLKATKDTD